MLYHFLTVGFSLFAVAFLVKAIGFYGDYKESPPCQSSCPVFFSQ